LIGSALVPFLRAEGHSVVRLVRGRARVNEECVLWNPETALLEASQLDGFDAVIHLAGENVGTVRWSHEKKSRILQSRVNSTRLLSETLAALKLKPRVLVSASAIGFYGSRGDELLAEDSTGGIDFFSEVCSQWEAATRSASEAGIRVVNPRFGLVLAANSGALAKMLPSFRWGMGAILGDGNQVMSWIMLEDVLGFFRLALTNGSLSGPANVVAPAPVTQREFARTLGQVLGRPVLLRIPRSILRVVFGTDLAEVLLSSQRVSCARLESFGFEFRYPELHGALRHLLKKSGTATSSSGS
jgi:uncharacterized protein